MRTSLRINRYSTQFICISAFAGLCLLTGCSGGEPVDPNVIHVTGSVTFDGKPLPLGMVVFEPDTAKGNHGQQGHADIKEGKFDTRQSGQGAMLGAQIVRITGGDGVNPEPFTPFGNMLFEEHTVRIDIAKDQPLELKIPGRKPN